jgi:hypothetical protein
LKVCTTTLTASSSSRTSIAQSKPDESGTDTWPNAWNH